MIHVISWENGITQELLDNENFWEGILQKVEYKTPHF